MPTYQPTDSEVADLTEKVSTALADLSGFPRTPQAVEYFVRRLLQIVWCRPIVEIPGLNGKPSPGFDTNPYQRLIAAQPEFEGACDDDWVIGEIADRFEKFPSLIAWRKIYCDFLPPRDGRKVEDLEVA